MWLFSFEIKLNKFFFKKVMQITFSSKRRLIKAFCAKVVLEKTTENRFFVQNYSFCDSNLLARHLNGLDEIMLTSHVKQQLFYYKDPSPLKRPNIGISC